MSCLLRSDTHQDCFCFLHTTLFRRRACFAYESYVHPLTILSGLPSAAFGALVTLLLFGIDLNIYAFVGMIMLIGIVEKNAIMQIDFALEAQRSGMSAEEAIYQGCLVRFRPPWSSS